MDCIGYKSGYKYQIKKNYSVEIPIKPESDILSEFITLDTNGILTLKSGYAWDGPSGPTIDTLNFMRGSLVHDALYQLMREGFLDSNVFREPSDQLLQTHCKEDGMSFIRAWIVYIGVRFGGGPSTKSANGKPLCHAPKNCNQD